MKILLSLIDLIFCGKQMPLYIPTVLFQKNAPVQLLEIQPFLDLAILLFLLLESVNTLCQNY